MSEIRTYTYDLGAGWKLMQTVNDGVEVFVFSDGKEKITLLDESVKKLRYLFNKTIG